MSPELPPALRLAVDRLMEGKTRRDLAGRAMRISQAYRARSVSAAVVADAADATAYVLSRLPATYAACARAFAEAAEIAPDFAPTRLLDAGAGPGGAGWAAIEAWPSLDHAVLLDSNPAFLEMAATLGASGPAALQTAERLRVDLARPGDWPRADLVVASYALAEIPPGGQATMVEGLWAACSGLLVLVEPGTPDGWRRILAARDLLIGGGARVLAPCPHALACPLAAPGWRRQDGQADDWCHFVQRLPRSRDHRQAKGADAPFEDEKFVYLAVARPGMAAEPARARVLAPPRMAKPAITLKLCRPDGACAATQVARRDKPAFALARRLDWGDQAPAGLAFNETD